MERYNCQLTGQVERALIQNAAKKPVVTLEELQKSTTQLGESAVRTTVIHAHHKSGLLKKIALFSFHFTITFVGLLHKIPV